MFYVYTQHLHYHCFVIDNRKVIPLNYHGVFDYLVNGTIDVSKEKEIALYFKPIDLYEIESSDVEIYLPIGCFSTSDDTDASYDDSDYALTLPLIDTKQEKRKKWKLRYEKPNYKRAINCVLKTDI